MVTLCPSLLEGFGLPVLEALTLGCPVVLSTDAAQVEAAAGSGTPVAVDDRQGWVEAIVEHLDHRRPVRRPEVVREWSDVASELVDAAGRVLADRGNRSAGVGTG